MIDHGGSLADCARELGVSRSTVKRWADELRAEALAKPAPSIPAAGPPTREPLPPLPVGGDPLALNTALQARLLAQAQEAAESGNMNAASSLAGHASKLAPVIARLESTRVDERDVIRLSRADIDAGVAEVLEVFRAYAARGPLRCADCGRALAVRLGTATNADPRQEDHAENPANARKV